MRKFITPKYNEVLEKKVSNNETSFVLQPLERGFGNTMGTALRRVMLSSIHGVAPFAIKARGVQHEFQSIDGVKEDVVQLVLNLKRVRFVYDKDIFPSGDVITISLSKTNADAEVTGASLTLPNGVTIVNPDEYIATVSKKGSLEFEMFLTSGRGYQAFEENKEFIKRVSSKINSKIQTGSLIAIDSDFSPVKKVSFNVAELNSSSPSIEEKLEISIQTDESVEAKEILAESSQILIGYLNVLEDISNLDKENLFMDSDDQKPKEKAPIPISELELSIRSLNSLQRAGYKTLEELSTINAKELGDIKNLGAKSKDEILEKLSQYGITLEEDK